MLETSKFKRVVRDVRIPVWIRKTARDPFGPVITPQDLAASGADMWLSIQEIRSSDLKELGPSRGINRDVICAKGHNYEWLCCGSIPKSSIMNVMPWDGKDYHISDPGYPIRSFENSGQSWVFNWNKSMWLPDSFKRNPATLVDGRVGDKRKAVSDEEYDNGRVSARYRSTQYQALTASKIITTIDIPPISA